MTRNLDHRVELMFPIEDRANAAKVISALDVLLRDTVKGRVLQSDGVWKLPAVGPGAGGTDAQAYFDELATTLQADRDRVSFEPVERPA